MREKCLFLMYFWALNSSMFPEFLYHPHLSSCIRLCESLCESLGAVGGSLYMLYNKQSRAIHVWLIVLCRLLARAQCVILSEVRGVCSTINTPRKCVNSSDAFCYICGEVTFKFRRRSFTTLINKCYEHYFGCKVGYQDKRWATHFWCVTVPGFSRLEQKVHVVCDSHGLERAHGPCFRFLILPDQCHWCNNKVQTHCSIP